MKRAALYVRVSTAEQKNHGISVESQIAALQKYCDDNGMKIAGIYNDAGISARKKFLHRPELLRLIADCKHNMIDLILFTRIDRWFRSVADYYEVQGILDEYKVPWRAIWEDYETETSSGIFKVNLMLSIGQAESDRTSEKIRSVFDHQRAKGDYVGKVPFGYKRENHRLVCNDDEKPFVDTLFDTYLKEYSVSSVYKKMQEIGHPMSKSGICYMLKNPVYFGGVGGVEYTYISEEQHNDILRWLSSFIHKAENQHPYIFSGLLTCKYCGMRMNTGRAKDSRCRKGPKIYYNYNCLGKRNVQQHEVSFAINEIKLEKLMVDSIDDLVKEENLKRYKTVSSGEDYSKKIDNLKSKRKRILVLYEEGDITADEYKEKRNLINSQISEYEYLMADKTDVVLPENWKDMYYDLSFENRRIFWRSFVAQIRIGTESRNEIRLEDIDFL